MVQFFVNREDQSMIWMLPWCWGTRAQNPTELASVPFAKQ